MPIRVLLLEDDQGMVDLLTRFLRPVSSVIESTDNLEEGMEKARTGSFNIILLDLNLMNTGKEEAFHAIRELKSFNTAVVVVTGLSDPHLKEDAQAAGADCFVSKLTDHFSQSVLLAAHIATLHLPRGSFKSDSYLNHVELLRELANAAPDAA
jgi:DNA-binding NarL/FixJ family response regulator